VKNLIVRPVEPDASLIGDLVAVQVIPKNKGELQLSKTRKYVGRLQYLVVDNVSIRFGLEGGVTNHIEEGSRRNYLIEFYQYEVETDSK
jgi:hypothetical protein